MRKLKHQFNENGKAIRFAKIARLNGNLAGCFKIKLRTSGFRLIYQVIDEEIVI